MKNVFKKISFLLGLLFISSSAWSWAVVNTGTITYIENGWAGEGFAIHMSSASTISGCSAPSNEFGISADHPAYKIIVAMMINAYTQQSNVQLVVEQGVCTLGNRTKVISLRLF